MRTNRTIAGWLMLPVLLTLNLQPSTTFAQGTTAFTYQGQLRDGGTNANGAYTIIFALYDAVSGGDLIAGPVTNSATLANGLFTVNLDFGAGAFNGNARWLDITVSNGVAQTLSPRVQVLPSPYALYAAVAATVTNGAIMNAQLSANAVATMNIQNNAITMAQIATNTISSVNLASNAVSTFNIQSNAVTTGQIADGSITAAKLAPNTPPHGMVFSSTNGTFTFTVPAGVTSLFIEAWGAGGGGGGGCLYLVWDPVAQGWDPQTAAIGGGGGAGGYARGVINVVPLTQYTVQVGAGGPGGSDGSLFGMAGENGGDTSFGNIFVCCGGQGGGAGAGHNNGSAGVGGAAEPSATIHFSGPNGGGYEDDGYFDSSLVGISATGTLGIGSGNGGKGDMPQPTGNGGNVLMGVGVPGNDGCILIQW